MVFAVLALYFCLLMLISHFTGKRTDNDTFFLGNRKSLWFVVAVGMVGSSVSGVSYVSVPGWVVHSGFTYMQMVLGFFFGYAIVAEVLLPLYYKLRLTSIYSYLDTRFGKKSQKTGAGFFFLANSIGAAARLYVVAIVLQQVVFVSFGAKIPFVLMVAGILLLIWLYTFRGGFKTIIWTDVLQTFFLVLSVILIIWQLLTRLDLNIFEAINTIAQSDYSRMFVFDDWTSRQNFWKQFLSGIFVVIAMTGLDQDMMQKNLTCKTLKDAKRNMYACGLMFIPLNLLFLSMGVLMYLFAAQNGIALPQSGDEVLPMLATPSVLGTAASLFFIIGIVSVTFSSSDSTIAALCTSFYIDILGKDEHKDSSKNKRIRSRIYFACCALLLVLTLLFRLLNDTSLIDAIYTIVSYTYGPLLGLFAFGLFCKKRKPGDHLVPYICIASPLLIAALQYISTTCWNYTFGYELLILNGFISFCGLWAISKKI
ncbi:MAG: sodium:solute symporter [Prevotellaceae bacterium]|jgi:SSS family transporter|nr:sodium:solute symporter [Prevotellaceae bacterium]